MIDRSKVLEFATRKHTGQKRKDGKDYITHPIAVAEIALELFELEEVINWKDEDPNVAESDLNELRDEIYILSLLHDVYEDTDTTLEEIEELFGNRIRHGVNMLSNKDKVMTYFDFIMRLVNRPWDWTIRLVKRADLRHNMSDLSEGSMKDKYRFAEHLLKP